MKEEHELREAELEAWTGRSNGSATISLYDEGSFRKMRIEGSCEAEEPVMQEESVQQRDPEGIVGLSLPGSTIRAPAEKESQSANLDFQVNAKTKFFNGKLDEVKTDDHYMKFEFGNHETELKHDIDSKFVMTDKFVEQSYETELKSRIMTRSS